MTTDCWLFWDSEDVRAKRRAAGLTQEALARAANISLRTLVRVENGGQGSLRTLRGVAGALEQAATEAAREVQHG